METTQVPSTDEWIKKMESIYLASYYLHKIKEENLVICNMDRIENHYVNWNKPITDGQRPHDLLSMWASKKNMISQQLHM